MYVVVVVFVAIVVVFVVFVYLFLCCCVRRVEEECYGDSAKSEVADVIAELGLEVRTVFRGFYRLRQHEPEMTSSVHRDFHRIYAEFLRNFCL